MYNFIKKVKFLIYTSYCTIHRVIALEINSDIRRILDTIFSLRKNK